MNKKEFSKYIAENFNCSRRAADAIITLFSESIYMAISEGHEINLEHFGKFAVKNIHTNEKYNKPNIIAVDNTQQIVYTKLRRIPYFTPAQDLKTACSW